MWPNPPENAALVTFIEEILNGKLHFSKTDTTEFNFKLKKVQLSNNTTSLQVFFARICSKDLENIFQSTTSNRYFYIFELKVRDTKFKTIPESIWWAIITMTTVGYGDMTPSSTEGKIFGAFCSTCSILILALPVSVIGNLVF